MEALHTLTLPAPKPKVAVKFKFETVQIARGLAALCVVLYHCNSATVHFINITPLNGIFKIGLFGVDFFFVLSGFIITYMHLNDLKKGANLSTFIKKRFIRIYPVFWVVAAITFIYLLVVQKGKHLYTGHILDFYSYTDWVYLFKSVLLFPQKVVGLVDVSWTLSFEVLFYLVFAVCIGTGWRMAKFIFFAWIACIIINSTGIAGVQNYYLNFILSTNILEFLSGCLLAYIIKAEKVKLTWPVFISFAAILGVSSFIYLKVFHNQLSRKLMDMVFIIGFSTLFLWASITIDMLKKKLSLGPLKRLLLVGDASYSIYLVHTLVIDAIYVLLSGFFFRNNIFLNQFQANALFVLIVSAAAGTGVFCHLYIEKPLYAYMSQKFIPRKPSISDHVKSN